MIEEASSFYIKKKRSKFIHYQATSFFIKTMGLFDYFFFIKLFYKIVFRNLFKKKILFDDINVKTVIRLKKVVDKLFPYSKSV